MEKIMKVKNFASGSCLCGKVKYTISTSPVRMGQCHCDDCRKSTGTGHASNAFFEKNDVNIIGETKKYDSVTDTKSIITRHFCPTCGSRMFGESNILTNIIAVSAGTIDDSTWFKADAIVYDKRKPIWDIMDENIPSFKEMPPAT